MRKKLILYILLTVITSSLLVSIILALYSKHKLNIQIAREKSELVERVSNEYQYISSIVDMAKRQIILEYEKPLIELAHKFNSNTALFKNLTSQQLKDYSREYNVDQLYIINKQGIIENSSLEAEIGYNLNNEGAEFMKNFNNLFETHTFQCQGLASSSVDNALTFYTYYAPKNASFVLESSFSLEEYLTKNYSNELSDIVFWGIKRKIIYENPLIAEFEVFNLIDFAKISLFDSEIKLTLTQNEIGILEQLGTLSIEYTNSEDFYKTINLKTHQNDFSEALLLYVKFNYSEAITSYWHLVLINAFVFFMVLFVISLAAIFLVNKFFIGKVEIINHNLEHIKRAEYYELTTVESSDELSTIAKNIVDVKNNVMEREQQLVEAKTKAVESDKLKTMFLSNMSHEIRTPLNAIVGFSHLLSAQFPQNGDAGHFANIISENSDQLLKLITDIIDISKIESNQLQIVYKKTDVNHILIEASEYAQQRIEFYAKNADKASIEFKLNKHNLSKGYFIKSNQVRLNQVLEHLLDNAAKFTYEGTISLTLEEKNEKLYFSISDTGIGFDCADVDKIFDKFVQIKENLIREQGGTGIGLAICKAIITLMGGKIKGASIKNEGSCFSFYIPYVPIN